MSVWVFKSGEDKELIPAELLESQLAVGWSVTDPDTVAPASKDIGSSSIFDAMSSKEVRDKAKEAGIEDHDKARINTLREKLEAS